MEHYEISRYGTLISWARRLGNQKAASLLEANLNEEKGADRLLTELAEAAVNDDAEAAARSVDDTSGVTSKKQPPARSQQAQSTKGKASRKRA